MLGGARDALQNTWDTVWNAGKGLAQSADKAGLNVLGLPVPQDGQKFAQLPEVAKEDESTTRGAVLNAARDVERFLLGFAGGGAMFKAAGIGFKGVGAASGAVGDFMVTGPDDGRLVDLFDKVPALQGPVLEALKTDGEDDYWMHKIASAAEGVLVGGALEALIRGVGAIRRVVKAQESGDRKAIEAAVDEITPELEAALKSLNPDQGVPGVPRASRAAAVEGPPPPKEGTVRVYHGGAADPKSLDELHVTTHLPDAEGWAGRSSDMKVWYADVPGDSPWLTKVQEDADALASRHVAPKEVLEQFQPFSGEAKAAPKDTPTVSPSGQHEMFPEVVRREEAIHDIQLQVKGDRWIDPETGKEKLLPLSNRAREELNATVKDPNSPVHLDKLTPETRDELVRVLASDNEAARWFNPKTVRGKPFDLGEGRKVEFDKALENSLTIPYATLKANAPGTAIEDVIGTFFNYRYMDSADAVKSTLSQLADVMKPMVDKHVGGFHQSFDKVQELADWIGMRPDTLTAVLSQQARGAEYMPAMVVAGKTWIQSLTQDIVRISRSIDSGLATDTAKIELERRKDILADLIGTVKSVQKSAARTTAAGRIRTAAEFSQEEIGTLLKEIGEDGFKFVSRALQLSDGNPKAVINLLEPSFGAKTWGVANEFWINGLLSGLGTHIVNITSGAYNTALMPAFRITGGLVSGDMKSVRVGLGQYSALRSVIFDSFEMARRSLVTENAYVDASFHQVERERTFIKADTFGLDGGDVLGQGIEHLGNVIRMPSRFLTASDEFLKQMNYRASVIARAHEEAIERGLKDDVKVSYFINGEKKMISQVDEYVMDRLNQAFHPRTEAGLDEAALRDARRATFTQPLREATWTGGRTVGEFVQQAAAHNPWLRHTVLPFTRVPTNIFREMIYESPAAPLRAQFWADMKAGGEARSDALGRVAMGSMFWTGAAMLASEGIITGKGPSDPQLQKQLRSTGWQPYSVVFRGAGPEGKDLYIAYNRLDPWAGILGIAADFAYLAAHVDERTKDQLATNLTLSLANNLNSRSYMRSMTELSAILGQSNSPNAPNLVQRWLNSRASSYVPRIVGLANPDDTMRDARTMMEAVQARIPGLSADLPPMRDNFGAPIAPAVGWPWKEVNPFMISVGKDGAARKELAYWANGPTRTQFVMPHASIDGVLDLRDFKNEKTGQSAYDRWLQVLTEPKFGGKTSEERLDDLVKSDGYRELKKAGKEDPFYRNHPAADLLRKEMNRDYDLAKKLMLAEPGFEKLQMALAEYDAGKRSVPLGADKALFPNINTLLEKR